MSAQRNLVSRLMSIGGGLVIATSPLLLWAQANYVDVEAERRATGPTAPVTVYGTAAPMPVMPASSAPGAGSADLGRLFMQVQQLQEEVMRLNGLVEEQAHELRTLKTQSLERYMDLDRRLGGAGASPVAAAGSNSGQSARPLPGGSTAAPPAASGGLVTAEQPGEGDAYRAAYALVRGQEFDAAVVSFRQFLQRFPTGRYAPNAHYWLGELYLVQQPPDPEAARQSFMLLLDAYPDNAKVPDALYKLGRVHLMKGSPERAREFLQRAINEHPDSAAAGLARDFIAQNLGGR